MFWPPDKQRTFPRRSWVRPQLLTCMLSHDTRRANRQRLLVKLSQHESTVPHAIFRHCMCVSERRVSPFGQRCVRGALTCCTDIISSHLNQSSDDGCERLWKVDTGSAQHGMIFFHINQRSTTDFQEVFANLFTHKAARSAPYVTSRAVSL